MIRLIFVVIFLLLYFILGLPVLGVLWLIGKWNKPAADIASLRIVQWAFKVILFLCGTKLTVIGEENVPKDQPVLYIANHQSYFDIVVSYECSVKQSDEWKEEIAEKVKERDPRCCCVITVDKAFDRR